MAGKFAAAFALFVSATLSPAWGQNSATAVVQYNAVGARVGVEPDGSTWQTKLWWINTYAGDQAPGSVTFLDANGNWLQLICTTPAGVTETCVKWNGGPWSNGSANVILTGLSGMAAQDFTIQLATTGGYAISAISDHLDVNGNVIPGDTRVLTDPGLLAPITATRFAVGLEVVDEINLVLNNPSAATANITVSAYDDNWFQQGRPPFATVTVALPPQGRLSTTVSQAFAGDADYSKFLAGFAAQYGAMIDGYLLVTSDQPIRVAASIMRFPQGAEMIQQVPWHAFPGSPDPNLKGIAGYSAANGYTAWQITAGQYAILFGSFAASGNQVMLNGQPVPASAITYEGVGQINISLGTLVTSGYALFSVSNPDGTSNQMSAAVVPQ